MALPNCLVCDRQLIKPEEEDQNRTTGISHVTCIGGGCREKFYRIKTKAKMIQKFLKTNDYRYIEAFSVKDLVNYGVNLQLKDNRNGNYKWKKIIEFDAIIVEKSVKKNVKQKV